jgi:hypothetical protein
MFMPPPFERWHGIIHNDPPLPRKIGGGANFPSMREEIPGLFV